MSAGLRRKRPGARPSGAARAPRLPRGGREQRRRLTCKLCSLALQYPDDDLLAMRAPAVDHAAALGRAAGALALRRFVGWWREEPALKLRQHYVETFDLQKRSGLYLTYYTDGDRRDRGLALLRLRKLYRAAGLPMASGELPDYLPVMLEFAAAAPPAYAEVPLREHRAALELLGASLRERGTPYADVLDAVQATLGSPSPAERAEAAKIALKGPPQELVGVGPELPPTTLDAATPQVAASGACASGARA